MEESHQKRKNKKDISEIKVDKNERQIRESIGGRLKYERKRKILKRKR